MSDDFGEMLKKDVEKRGEINDSGITIHGIKDSVNLKFKDKEYSKEELQKIVNEIYDTILLVLRKYLDLREDYYHIVATWIIGTYIHKDFPAYPYLFFNAMRGSGKTRALKVVEALSNNGSLVSSIREAVLFRLPKDTTLLLDEMESINSKEMSPVRELLNASYKKGSKVFRLKKVVKENGKQDYELEPFEPYKPICMANIWGQEEVLGDRCISLVLEKSNRPDIMRRSENFEDDILIKKVKNMLSGDLLVLLCRFFCVYGVWIAWEKWLDIHYNITHTHTTLTTQTQQTTQQKIHNNQENFFKKVHDSNIVGRDLELFLPLFIISHKISEEHFNRMLVIADLMNKEKRVEQMTESRDISLFDFVSQLVEREDSKSNLVSIKELTQQFKDYLNYDEIGEDRWLNTKWMGRALKRLGLIIDSVRKAGGRYVSVDVKKAQEKMRYFEDKK